MSNIPPQIANQLLTDCLHRCCLCQVEEVQLHHIDYIVDNGDNSYENLIPLCPNCHSRVHTSQAAAGQPGVLTRAITPEQLRIYKSKMIEKCSSLIQIFIKNGLAEGSEWHYYWHKNRIPELWDSLSLPPKSHEKRPEDLPTYNRVLAEKLSEFIERKGVWDLPLILNETVSELESLIGKYVTFAGRFEGTVQTQNYYLDPQSGWDNKHPTLFTTINVNGIDIKVIIDIDPNNVVSTTTFLKLSREPYLKVIGHVWNASTDKKEIYITPLHLCPNFK